MINSSLSWLHFAHDTGKNVGRILGCVDNSPTSRLFSRQPKKALTYPFVEIQWQPIDPIFLGQSAKAQVGRKIEKESYIGLETLGRKAVCQADKILIEAAHDRLVHNGGVRMAIAKHDFAPLKRRPHHLLTMVGTVRQKQEKLRPVRDFRLVK
jgi:hypothetical protein